MSPIHRRRAAQLATVIALFAAGSVSAGGVPAGPFFTGLGDLPGGDFESSAMDCSADGEVVVGWSKAVSGPSDFRAFRWTFDAGMTDLGDLSGEGQSIAWAISADGSIIVGRSDACDCAFRWTAATGMVDLNMTGAPPGFTATSALGISADGGVIVGAGRFPHMEAYRWTAATGVVPLGHLPTSNPDSFASGVSADGTVITGESMSGDMFAVEPIRWTQETGMVGLGDVPGGIFYGLGMAISADGSTIVGDAIGPLGGFEGFRWTAETGLAVLAPELSNVARSTAADSSFDGTYVIGSCESPIDGAYIWDPQTGMRNVQAILESRFGIDLTGWSLLGASGISDDARTIVGVGENPSGNREAWLARVAATVPGDIDGNAVVTLGDLAGFVAVLLGQDVDWVHVIVADMNGDGIVDGRDVGEFVDVLTS